MKMTTEEKYFLGALLEKVQENIKFDKDSNRYFTNDDFQISLKPENFQHLKEIRSRVAGEI